MANTVSRTISDETLSRIIQIESAGRPNVKAATSSALGLGQFLNGTWLDVVRRHRPDLMTKPRAEVLALRTEPKIAIEMLARFTEDNAAALGAGYTDGDLYLAHFAGVGTAKKLLDAPAGHAISRYVSQSAIKANNSILQGKTVGQVRDWAAHKMAAAGKTNWVEKYYGPAPSQAPHGERTNEIRQVQKRLDTMGYSPGEIDGKWGGRTAGAIAAFKNDRRLLGEPVIDAALLAELDKAEAEGFKRPIAKERREATPDELAPKLPEVKEAQKAERMGFWAKVGTLITMLGGAASEFFSDVFDWMAPAKDFAADNPVITWLLIGGAAFGILFYITRKIRNAKDAAVEAYQEGSRT